MPLRPRRVIHIDRFFRLRLTGNLKTPRFTVKMRTVVRKPLVSKGKNDLSRTDAD
jgi:hypothetical protein